MHFHYILLNLQVFFFSFSFGINFFVLLTEDKTAADALQGALGYYK